MASNIDLQKQLNDLLDDAAVSLDKQTKQYQSQAQIIAQMVRAQQALNSSFSEDKLENLASSLEAAAKAAASYGEKESQIKAITKALGESKTQAEVTGAALGTLTSKLAKLSVGEQALKGIANGFAFVANTAHGLLSTGATLIKTLGNLAISIITFPFRLLQNLIDASDSSGNNELAQALEDIRKEFGYLNKTVGGTVVSLAKSMQGTLAQTGLSVYRVFGNLAERLKYVAEYAKNLGPVFEALHGTVGEGGAEALGAYNKALGLTAEGQKAVATRALSSGQSVNEVNRQIANYALHMSSQFGITMKEISRDIGNMMADFEHFGHLAPQQLAQVSTYARRLGIEVKALSGVMEKNFSFESAATGAAQLSQAFGLNIDALEQLKEQDPARQMDNLRKAFFAAGRSIEGMTAQERRLLASQTGLDAASLDATFSLKNQAIGYADIQKKGDAARKSQVSQAQAMQQLAGAIERLVQSGSSGHGGFFDRFFHGFDVGVKRTQEYRQIMMNLRRDTMATYRAGIQVGQAFVHAFPGVRDVFKGISEFFDPHRFRAMLSKVVDAFKGFFTDLTQNPRLALPRLLERLKTGFFDFFRSGSQAGRRLLDGTKAFFGAFITIANSVLTVGLSKLTEGIQYVVDLLTGRKSLPTASAGGAGGFLANAFARLIDGLPPILERLWEAIKGLFGALWARVSPWLQKSIVPAMTALFGPSVIMAITRGITTALVTSLSQALLKGLSSRLLGSAVSRATPGIVQKARETVESASQRGVGQAAGNNTEALSNAGGGMARGAEANQNHNWRRVGQTLVLIAGVIVIGMGALLLAIAAIRRFNIQPAEIVSAAGMLIATLPLILAAALVVRIAQSVPSGNAGALAQGLLFVGAVAVSMAALGGLIVAAVSASGISRENITKAGIFITEISGLFLAASAVVGIATLIGAAVAGSGGIGAAAVAVGLAFIAGVVVAMTAQGMAIMRTLDGFRISPGFREKASAFLDIVRAIGSFAATIGTIMASVAPGIIGTLSSAFFGTDPQAQLQKTLGGIQRIIEGLGTQIVRIIDSVMHYAQNMSPEAIHRGEIIGHALGAVAGLAAAMAGPAELFKDTSAWWEGSDVATKLQRFGENITTMSAGLVSITRAVAGVIGQIGNTGATEASLRAGQLIGTVLKGIGELAQNLMPRRATIEALNGARDFSGALTNINRFTNQLVRDLIGSGILPKISQFVTGFVTAISGLSAAQAARAISLAPVVAEAMKALTSVSGLLLAVLPTNIATPPNPAVITALTAFMSDFLERIKNIVPDIITKMLEVTSGITPGQLTNIRGSTEAIKNLFETIGVIPALVASFTGEALSGATRSTAASTEGIQRITDSVNNLRSILNGVFDSSFSETLQRLGGINLPHGFRGKLETLKVMFETLATIPTAISSFSQAASGGAETTDVRAQVNSMLGKVTELLDSLTQPYVAGGLPNPFLRDSGAGWIGNMFGRFSVPSGISQKLSGTSTVVTDLLAAITTIANLQIPESLTTAAIQDKMFRVGSLAGALNGKVRDLVTELETGHFEQTAGQLTRSLQTAAFGQIGEGIRKMVEDVNQVSTELARLEPINITNTLGQLAHNMGLGQTRELTINRGRIQMVINSTTTINAGDLEYVLINRAGSEFASLRRNGS